MSQDRATAERLRNYQLVAVVVATAPAALCALAWGATGTQLFVPLVTAIGALVIALLFRRTEEPTTLSVAWPVLWWMFVYQANVDAIMHADPSRFVDGTLAGWDAVLFGRGEARVPTWEMGGALEELGNAFYVSFFVGVPLGLFWAWRTRGELAALQHGLTLLASIGLCSLVWLVFPSGGIHETGSPPSVGLGPATAFARWVYSVNPHFAAAFPSGHVANAAGCATLLALQGSGRLWPLWAACVGFGAVYGQYHHFVDIPPGFLIGAGVAWLVSRIGPYGQTLNRIRESNE